MSNETYKKQEKMPLFDERARKSHPDTSHKHAEALSGSEKLCRMMKFTLMMVFNYPGRTATQLKQTIFNSDTYTMEQMEWPQKCMSRLVDYGLVRREKNSPALKCFITPAGKRKLGV